MKTIFILGPCRSAIGSFNGGLKTLSAVRLGALAIQEAISRSGIAPEAVDGVLMGNALQAGLGQNPARQAAVGAGLPFEVPAMTLNKVCGSGLAAISQAAALIRAGEGDCFIAGGMESMSNAPYYLPSMRGGARMGDSVAVDGMLLDGLWDAFGGYHMGITAENLAQRFSISREEQDAYALESQHKAAEAQKGGRFTEEVFPVEVPLPKSGTVIFDRDEYIRPDTTAERLAQLRPAFTENGSVTAGNASGVNDGAAAMIIASEDFVRKHGLIPFAIYVSGGSAGVEPSVMGLGPVPSVRAALKKASLTVEDIARWESNEAFAVQALAVSRELSLPPERVNVNGGAIALGHPIGASGARITVTLLHEMKRRNDRYGAAALCIGGGMGEAAIFRTV